MNDDSISNSGEQSMEKNGYEFEGLDGVKLEDAVGMESRNKFTSPIRTLIEPDGNATFKRSQTQFQLPQQRLEFVKSGI